MTDITPAIERAADALWATSWHLTRTDLARAVLSAALDVDEIARAIYETAPGYRGAYGTWSYDALKAGWSEKPYPEYPHLYDDLLRQAEAVRAALLGGEG